MVIKNTRRSLITFEYKKNGNRTLVPIPAGSKVDVPSLIELTDIISKDFFSKGWLIVSEDEKQEIEITEKIEETKNKKNKKKSSNNE